jgi:hypothetical protein
MVYVAHVLFHGFVNFSLNPYILWQERAKLLNIPTHNTIDAGRTQIAPSELQKEFLLGN